MKKRVKLSPVETARIQKEQFHELALESCLWGGITKLGILGYVIGNSVDGFFQLWLFDEKQKHGGIIIIRHTKPGATSSIEINYLDMYLDFGFAEYTCAEELNTLLDQAVALRKRK